MTPPPASGRSRFGSRWDPETDEIQNPDPYDFGGAKRAHARSSRDMTAAAEFRVTAAEQYAEAESAYRQALAAEIIRQHVEEGAAWSVAGDLARGAKHVAELKVKRDAAEGMRDAAEQLAWKASADRRGIEQLVDWSMRVAPLGEFPEGARVGRGGR